MDGLQRVFRTRSAKGRLRQEISHGFVETGLPIASSVKDVMIELSATYHAEWEVYGELDKCEKRKR